MILKLTISGKWSLQQSRRELSNRTCDGNSFIQDLEEVTTNLTLTNKRESIHKNIKKTAAKVKTTILKLTAKPLEHT